MSQKDARAYARLVEYAKTATDLAAAPTGILLTSFWSLTSLGECDGGVESRRISASEWEQQYSDLQEGQVQGAAPIRSFAPLATLKRLATEMATRGLTPLSVVDLRHNYLTPRLLESLADMPEDADVASWLRSPGNVDERRSVFASPVLSDRYENFTMLPLEHVGLSPRFVLDRRFFITNHSEEPAVIEADFADGHGFRALNWGAALPVTYDAPGEKAVEVRVEYPDETQTARFTLAVRTAPQAPGPDETWPIQASIEYDGKKASGQLFVLYGSTNGVKHTALQQPTLLVEGFPGWPYSVLYARFNQENLLTTMLANGHDAVLCSFGAAGQELGGTDYIQANAFVVIAAIQKVNSMGAPKPLTVLGASMGGVASRYALSYMEANSMPHNTKTFVTFDSPHTGANVPVSVQALSQYLGYYKYEEGKKAVRLLDSPASQQLLIARALAPSGTPLSIPVKNRPAPYTSFYQELYSMAFPQQPKTVAITNGCGDGGEFIDGGLLELAVTGTPFQKYSAYAPYSYAAGTLLADIDLGIDTAEMKCVSPSDSLMQNLDGPQGGLGDFFQETLTGLKKHIHNLSSSMPHGSACFIPTASAVAPPTFQPGGDLPLFQPIPPQTPGVSACDEYVLSTENTEHTLVTPEIASYLTDLAGSCWPMGQPVNSFDQTRSGLAACPFQKQLYLFWKASNSGNIFFSASGGSAPWPNGRLINSSASTASTPAACTFQNRLYLFWKSGDSNCNLVFSSVPASFDPGQGTFPTGSLAGPTGAPFANVASAPTACQFHGKLYVFWLSPDNLICVATFDGKLWQGGEPIGSNFVATPGFPVSACVFRKQLLYLVFSATWRGTANTLCFSRLWDGVGWDAIVPLTGDTSPNSPAACAYLGQLYVFWRATADSNIIYFSASVDGSSFAPGKRINAANQTIWAPAACSFAEQLYVFWELGDGRMNFCA